MTAARLKILRPISMVLVLVIAGLVLSVRLGKSAPAAEATPISDRPTISAGNYCQSCHSEGDERLENVTAWRGEIAAAGVTPCPAMKTIQEELYYTERLLLSIDRYQDSLPGNLDTSALKSKLTAGQQGYLRLLDTPVTSLDAFQSEAQSVRFTLGKVYSGLQALDESVKRNRALIVGMIVSLILLGSLAWGWYNTRMVKGAAKPNTGSLVKTGILLVIVAGFFSLPLLRLPPQVDAAADPEAQAVQTELDTSTRAGQAADRAYARAWMIGQVSHLWQGIDQAEAETVFDQAMQAFIEVQTQTTALWGEAAAAREAAVSDPAAMEKAGLIAAEIGAARSRTWSLLLLAEANDRPDLLLEALSAAENAQGIYRDLDLCLISIAVAEHNLDAALKGLERIADPAVRAWGLRELISEQPSEALVTQATDAAREIADPLQRGLAMAEIAAVTENDRLLAEAAASIEQIAGPEQAYAWAALAGIANDPTFATRIDPADASARTLALLRSGQPAEAWNSSLNITDPYERSRSQNDILWKLAEVDPQQAVSLAPQVAVPLLRDRAMRIVISITGDASLVSLIENPYDQALAYMALGQLDQAEELAGELKETTPLVQLASLFSKSDPQRAFALIERIKREADKAEVLKNVAVISRDSSVFERALSMAAAARVRGDALAPARAALNLAEQFMDIDPELGKKALIQALQLAKRISIK